MVIRRDGLTLFGIINNFTIYAITNSWTYLNGNYYSQVIEFCYFLVKNLTKTSYTKNSFRCIFMHNGNYFFVKLEEKKEKKEKERNLLICIPLPLQHHHRRSLQLKVNSTAYRQRRFSQITNIFARLSYIKLSMYEWVHESWYVCYF